MAKKIKFISKGLGLIPLGVEAEQWLEKQPVNSIVEGTFSKPRNNKFHAKFFAMLNVAYANYEWPIVETQWGKAKCSFDMFREYVIIRGGHYEATLTPTGDIRASAKSIAFHSMDEDEFSQVYSDVLDVILKDFLHHWMEKDMEAAVNNMLGFA